MRRPSSSSSSNSRGTTLPLSPNVRLRRGVRRGVRRPAALPASSDSRPARSTPKAKASPKVSPKAKAAGAGAKAKAKALGKAKARPTHRFPTVFNPFALHDSDSDESDQNMSLHDRVRRRMVYIYRDWVDERDYNAAYGVGHESLDEAMHRGMRARGYRFIPETQEWTKP